MHLQTVAAPTTAQYGPNPQDFVPLVVPLASFGAMVAIVSVVLFFRYRSQRMKQDLVESFLERGQAVPPELLGGGPQRKSRNGDLRRGLVMLAGGLGLSLALFLGHEHEAAGYGAIPALIGLAFLIVWRVEAGPGGGATVDG